MRSLRVDPSTAILSSPSAMRLFDADPHDQRLTNFAVRSLRHSPRIAAALVPQNPSFAKLTWSRRSPMEQLTASDVAESTCKAALPGT